jgi:hypothetical protein
MYLIVENIVDSCCIYSTYIYRGLYITFIPKISPYIEEFPPKHPKFDHFPDTSLDFRRFPDTPPIYTRNSPKFTPNLPLFLTPPPKSIRYPLWGTLLTTFFYLCKWLPRSGGRGGTPIYGQNHEKCTHDLPHRSGGGGGGGGYC